MLIPLVLRGRISLQCDANNRHEILVWRDAKARADTPDRHLRCGKYLLCRALRKITSAKWSGLFPVTDSRRGALRGALLPRPSILPRQDRRQADLPAEGQSESACGRTRIIR